ncbi:MAG: thiamine diphosphokinase [Clostridia bacterium]|nr:thiamine diphosphokinase [Clostridia bacterium]
MKTVIVCNGSIKDYTYIKKYFAGADLIICADGGASHIRKFGITPSLLLGDFDSIDQEDYDYLKEQNVEIVTFPVEKDMTDTEIAVELAVEKGSSQIVILGGIGTRMDHSLSNIFLLKKLMSGNIKGIIADEYNEITLVRDHIRIEKEEGLKISLLPLTDKVVGVTTKGLYYPLNEATVEMGSTWGISNEFKEDIAEVTLKEGLLLVIKSRE